MERLYTSIVGSPVFDDEFRRPLTTIKDVVVDPETGKVVAFLVNITKKLVIVPMDVLEWKNYLRVHDHDAIIEANEVLRVEEVLKKHIRIFRSNVYTKSGKYLGKVVNMSFHLPTAMMTRIHVAREFLGLLRFESRILPRESIDEILPGKIVVTDDLRTEKSEEKVQLEDLAVN